MQAAVLPTYLPTYLARYLSRQTRDPRLICVSYEIRVIDLVAAFGGKYLLGVPRLQFETEIVLKYY